MSFSSTLIPIPAPIKSKSSAYALKERLNWGEPALTILDVRSREAYNDSRIMGALSAPQGHELDQVLTSLESDRDIYVYGESDEQTAEVAAQLRDAGYTNVAELVGGLSGWKVVDGPIEGSLAAVA